MSASGNLIAELNNHIVSVVESDVDVSEIVDSRVAALLGEKSTEWYGSIERAVKDDLSDMLEEAIKEGIADVSEQASSNEDSINELSGAEWEVEDHSYELERWHAGQFEECIDSLLRDPDFRARIQEIADDPAAGTVETRLNKLEAGQEAISSALASCLSLLSDLMLELKGGDDEHKGNETQPPISEA